MAWVSLEESEREPDVVLDLRRHRARHRGARGRGRRAAAAGRPPIRRSTTVLATVLNELSALPTGLDLVLDDYHLADGPAIAGDVGVPGRAPAAGRAPGDQHARRPRPAAGPAAGPRRARRGPRGRPPLHARRGGVVPQRGRRPRPRSQPTSRPSRAAPRGGSPPCSSPRCRCSGRDDVGRLHRGLRRRRPVRRGLPRRGGPGASARRRTQLPAADLDPRPAQRRPLRRRHGGRRRQGACSSCSTARTSSSSRSTTAATGTATTTCSPTSCAPTWYEERPADVADLHRRAGQLVRRGRRARARPSGTRWPPATSGRRPTWSSAPIPACSAEPAGGAPSGGWLDDIPPDEVRGPAGAGRRLHRCADVERRVRGRRRAPGRRRAAARPTTAGGPGRGRRRRSSPGCRARSRRTERPWP